MLVRRFIGQPFPKVGPSLVVLGRPCSHLYLARRIDYWARIRDFEVRLRLHARIIFAGWHNVELLVIPPCHRPIQYVGIPELRREWEASRLFWVPSPQIFVYYAGYIFKDHLRQNLVGWTATSGVVVCPFKFFLHLASTGISASVPGDSQVLSDKKGKLVSFLLRLRRHIQQYNVFELLRSSRCDINLDFMAYSCSWMVDWSRWESLWYP